MGEPTEVAPDHYNRIVAACAKANSTPTAPQEFPPDFLAHDESFCRLAVHAWYRCCHGGGVVLRPCALRFGSAYAGLEMLPSPLALIAALGDEMEKHRSDSLVEVAETEPPAEYVKLWNETLQRMFPTANDAA